MTHCLTIGRKSEEQRNLLNVFVRHNDKMWALVSEDQSCCHLSLHSHGNNQVCGGKHLYFLAKYKPESNEWEEKSSFELEKVRVGVCMVAKTTVLSISLVVP